MAPVIPGIEVLSDEFRELLNPGSEMVELASGMTFTEGCTWVVDGDYFIWSDVPANRILRWSEAGGMATFREPSNHANGNTVDGNGNILSCETSGRRVSIARPGETPRTLVDSYDGKRLTSPNDVIVKSDGAVWFTDPDYGFLHPEMGHGETPEQACNRVYRYDPATGTLDAVAEDMDKPNGLTFSPDESILYVSDTGATHGDERPHEVRAYDVVDGRRLENGRVFAEVSPWVPDGMRVDIHGNLFVAAGDGVQVFNPGGDMIGRLRTPEVSANCCFGRPDRRTLLICATSSVFIVRLNTAGAYPY